MREQSSQTWTRTVGIGLSGVLLFWVVAGAAQAQTPTRSATPTHSATPLPTASSTPTPTALPVCGDHKVEGVEECDDGNAFGGDGCSANCTFETPHIFAIDPERSNFVLQTRLASPLVHPPLGASFELVTGNPGPDGRIPVAIPLTGISIAPVQNLGACTCFRPVAVPQLFGNNNAGAGWINCAGAAPVDFAMTQDHSTGATDPECAATDEQTNDFACLEDAASPPACNPLSPHDGTCNGPLRAIGSGTGPTGSAVFWVAMSVSVVLGPDVAGCEPHPGVAAYGDDGLPCTVDDPGQRPARIIPLTTGRASSVISNTDDIPGQSIAAGELCGQAGCDVVATGAPLDCLALAAGNMGEAQTTNDDVFDGAALGMSVPILDAIDGVAKDVAISYWLNTTNGPTTTPTATWTVTMTPTNTPIITPSATFTPTVTKTPTRTKTPTETRTPPPTRTPTRTPTGRLESPTPTSAASPSPTATATPQPSSTPSAQPTPTTPVPSPTPTREPPSPSATPREPSPTPTEAHSETPTASPTAEILLGDANGDGAVTPADVSALIGQIFNGGARLESDANQDTRVNAADVSATILRL